MKNLAFRSAGIGSVILALILLVVIYTLLGTVDLVFMKGDFQVARMEDVRVISDLELSAEDVITGEELEYTYGEDNKDFNGDFNFRFEIAKTLIINLFTFKWEATDNTIVLTAK
ncbi:MAG: hypothetical protein IJX58_05740 [Clostridia bacterium]|nr:hypothetical protein [Clostridia bacterium]